MPITFSRGNVSHYCFKIEVKTTRVELHKYFFLLYFLAVHIEFNLYS